MSLVSLLSLLPLHAQHSLIRRTLYICSAVSLGDHTGSVVCFGGSAGNSNLFAALDFTSALAPSGTQQAAGEDESKSEVSVWAPHVFLGTRETTPASAREPPLPRTSAVAVRVGRYMFIHGGWSNSANELGDVWVGLLPCYLLPCYMGISNNHTVTGGRPELQHHKS